MVGSTRCHPVHDLNVCVTVHQQYNNVNKQQDATTFWFINLFKSALHVSGDKFAHPQEHFLTVEVELQVHLNRGTDRQQRRCVVPKAVYTVKSAPEDGRICRPKHVGLI